MTVTNLNLQTPIPLDALKDPSSLTDIDTVTAQALSVLNAGTSVTVGKTATVPGGAGDKDVVESAPEVEDADLATAQEADLEALVAYLQMEGTEQQIEAAKKRIEDLKAQLEKNHTESMEKINKAVEEMKKSEKASLASKIFGWIGVVASLAAAIVTTVVTGGAAAAVAFVGFGLAATSMVLSETGATEKICNAMAKSIQDTFGCSSTDAKIAANAIFSGLFLVATIATGAAGGVASMSQEVREGIDLAQSTVKIIQSVSLAVNMVVQGGGLASGIGTAVTSYLSGLAQADVKEQSATTLELNKILEQVQEEFEQLMQLFQNAVATLAQLLEERTKNEDQLAMMIAG